MRGLFLVTLLNFLFLFNIFYHQTRSETLFPWVVIIENVLILRNYATSFLFVIICWIHPTLPFTLPSSLPPIILKQDKMWDWSYSLTLHDWLQACVFEFKR